MVPVVVAADGSMRRGPLPAPGRTIVVTAKDCESRRGPVGNPGPAARFSGAASGFSGKAVAGHALLEMVAQHPRLFAVRLKPVRQHIGGHRVPCHIGRGNRLGQEPAQRLLDLKQIGSHRFGRTFGDRDAERRQRQQGSQAGRGRVSRAQRRLGEIIDGLDSSRY